MRDLLWTSRQHIGNNDKLRREVNTGTFEQVGLEVTNSNCDFHNRYQRGVYPKYTSLYSRALLWTEDNSEQENPVLFGRTKFHAPFLPLIRIKPKKVKVKFENCNLWGLGGASRHDNDCIGLRGVSVMEDRILFGICAQIDFFDYCNRVISKTVQAVYEVGKLDPLFLKWSVSEKFLEAYQASRFWADCSFKKVREDTLLSIQHGDETFNESIDAELILKRDTYGYYPLHPKLHEKCLAFSHEYLRENPLLHLESPWDRAEIRNFVETPIDRLVSL